MKQLLMAFALCAVIALPAFAQLPPDAVKLDKVKVSEKFKSHELDPVTLEPADASLPTWEHEGVKYGSSKADSQELFAKDPAKFAKAHDMKRWEMNFNESLSVIWCPVTDEISPGGNTIWEELGLKWESCCQFCNDTKTPEDFPRALERLNIRAAKSYEAYGGAVYTEGASSPVEGAIDLGGPMEVEETTAQVAKLDHVPAWLDGAKLEPTWSGGIGKVFENRCFECHRVGGAAPMAMMTVGQVRKWSKNLKVQIEQGNMPPWSADHKYDFANAKKLTQNEKDLILEWMAAGYPPGDGKFEPANEWGEWGIGTPDLIVALPEYTVPENATSHVREFQITPEIDDDKWVVASEVKPTDSFLMLEVNAGPLGAFYTGNGVTTLPAGHGFRLKKGEAITVRVLYTKEAGWEEIDDMSQIALKFADDASSITKEVHVARVANDEFTVAAGKDSVSAEGSFSFPEKGHVVAVTPIMRERGKAISVSIGGEEILSVPRWDQNWKFTYQLVEPMETAKGTTITVKGQYDNSDLNAANPDSSVEVKGADSSEVLEAWVLYTLDVQKSAKNRFNLNDEQLAKASEGCEKCAAGDACETVGTD